MSYAKPLYFINKQTQNNNQTNNIFDEANQYILDAFGKIRVTTPTTLLDIRFPGQNDGSANFLTNNLQIDSFFNGSYSGVYNNSKLLIEALGAGYYISQSRIFCTYQPGKSLLVMESGILYPGNDAYTTRIGYFNNIYPVVSNDLSVRNGLYFQHSQGIYSVNITNYTTGTPTTNSIIQSDWNIDKMDGTGISGLNLNFSKTQLFVIDMEWLGVGKIRFGFYAYGKIQYCHQVNNINILTSPYTSSINLPICYSIHNTQSTDVSANNFTQICSTVISEGGYTPLGKPFSISNQNVPVAISNTELPLLFLRGGGGNYYHQNIIPTSLTAISSSTNDFILYRLRLYLAGDSPVTGGSITWKPVNVNGYSVCEYSATLDPSSGYTGTFQTSSSIIIDENYFYGRGTNSFNPLGDIFSNQVLQITSNIENISDILVLTCVKIGSSSSSSLYGVLQWQEIY